MNLHKVVIEFEDGSSLQMPPYSTEFYLDSQVSAIKRQLTIYKRDYIDKPRPWTFINGEPKKVKRLGVDTYSSVLANKTNINSKEEIKDLVLL